MAPALRRAADASCAQLTFEPPRRPRTLEEMLGIAAQARILREDLRPAIEEVTRGDGDTLSLSTRDGRLLLTSFYWPKRQRVKASVELPCEGKLPVRLSTDLHSFAALADAPFYDRHISLTLDRDGCSLYVGKYWLALRTSGRAIPDQTRNLMLARIAELNAMNAASPPATLQELARTYERDTALSNLLKELRGHACQICGSSFVTKSGTSYSECHHLERLADGGLDVSSNMVILCPNHHRQFHHGVVDIIEHTSEFLTVSIDGEIHRCAVGLAPSREPLSPDFA